MTHPPVYRCLSGIPSTDDKEWIAMLSAMFARVNLTKFTEAGMSTEDARQLAGLCALDLRFNHPEIATDAE
jgi:hypothetical protein